MPGWQAQTRMEPDQAGQWSPAYIHAFHHPIFPPALAHLTSGHSLNMLALWRDYFYFLIIVKPQLSGEAIHSLLDSAFWAPSAWGLPLWLLGTSISSRGPQFLMKSSPAWGHLIWLRSLWGLLFWRRWDLQSDQGPPQAPSKHPLWNPFWILTTAALAAKSVCWREFT